MKLEVTDCRDNKAAAAQDSIITVKYSHEKQLTSIICDADIVTIGLTIAILQGKYSNYVNRLPMPMRWKIQSAIDSVFEEADYEQD